MGATPHSECAARAGVGCGRGGWAVHRTAAEQCGRWRTRWRRQRPTARAAATAVAQRRSPVAA
eukprot:3954861-Prymnesium_polylepis.1